MSVNAKKSIQDLRLAVIGLGYVGLPLAVEFGKKYPVVGFDINATRIEELKHGIDKTLEVTSTELEESSHLLYTKNPDDLKEPNCYIITVPTPIDRNKHPDLTPLLKASKTIGKVL
jgi:UDP-N-acetyl-D-galactosamine dehydrogenase